MKYQIFQERIGFQGQSWYQNVAYSKIYRRQISDSEIRLPKNYCRNKG